MRQDEFSRKHPGMVAVFGGRWWRALYDGGKDRDQLVRSPGTENPLKARRLWELSNLIKEVVR